MQSPDLEPLSKGLILKHHAATTALPTCSPQFQRPRQTKHVVASKRVTFCTPAHHNPPPQPRPTNTTASGRPTSHAPHLRVDLPRNRWARPAPSRRGAKAPNEPRTSPEPPHFHQSGSRHLQSCPVHSTGRRARTNNPCSVSS